MKNVFIAFLILLALLGLITCVGSAVGGAYFFGKNQPQTNVSVADIPGVVINPGEGNQPVTDIATVVANIEQLDIPEPGPASENILPTVLPMRTNLQLGDSEVLRQEFERQVGYMYENGSGSQPLNALLGAVVTSVGSVTYCFQGHTDSGDYVTPLPVQVASGVVTLIPGTRYCVGIVKSGELWGGVPIEDLLPLVYPYSQQTVNLQANVMTETQTVSVEIHARFGLLTQSVQSGNSQKITYDRPGQFMDWFLNASRNLRSRMAGQGTSDYIGESIDFADNQADSLATDSVIAPYFEDGGRDMIYLNQLEKDLRLYFTTPSPDSSVKWPFDNLREIAENSAIAAGYKSLDNFTVILDWPNPEKPGEWHYLPGMDSDNPMLVLNPDDHKKYQDNLYWYLLDQDGNTDLPPASQP